MRRKKQELARRPDRILPSSLLHPMPLPTYLSLASFFIVTAFDIVVNAGLFNA